jgi:hypothetical protein
METKYHKYFHWVALGGLCLCLNMQAQETVKQVYTKEVKTSYRCLNEQDMINLPLSEKTSVMPSKEKFTYTVYQNGNNITKVKSELTESNQIKYGMCKSSWLFYPTYTEITTCGNTRNMPSSESLNLSGAEMVDKTNLFNYTTDATFLQSISENGANYHLLTDGTLGLWKDSHYKSINKTTLTDKEIRIVAGLGTFQSKRLFKKFSNNQILLVYSEEDYLKTLNSGTKVSVKTKTTYNYPSLVPINGKVLDTEYQFPATHLASVITEKIIDQTEDEFMESMQNSETVCLQKGFEAVYDILGKKQEGIKTYNDIKNASLKVGIYIIKYTCNGKPKSKKIIIE